MNTLEQRFKKGGFEFSILKRQNRVALLKKWIVGGDGQEKSVSFEVVRIQHHNGFTLPNGVKAEATEYMPKSEDWGKLGWTFCKEESALEKFRNLSE